MYVRGVASKLYTSHITFKSGSFSMLGLPEPSASALRFDKLFEKSHHSWLEIGMEDKQQL